MNGFWSSDLGELTGKAEDAFSKSMRPIPDDTFAPAEIETYKLEDYFGSQIYNISWRIIDGEFKGRTVFQKIKAFDNDVKKRHQALNMMMYLYSLFNLKPKHSNAPDNSDLEIFTHKKAGLRIQLTKPNDEGKQYNYVSEVHNIAGFVPKSGVTVDSAFSRKALKVDKIDDDIPF